MEKMGKLESIQESKHAILSIENTIQESRKIDASENLDKEKSIFNSENDGGNNIQAMSQDLIGGSESGLDIMQKVNSDYIKSNLNESQNRIMSEDGNILHKIKAQSDIYCRTHLL